MVPAPSDRSRPFRSNDDATLRLLLASGLGPVTLRRLREHFDDDDAITAATAEELRTVRGIGPAGAASLRRAISGADPHHERRLMAERDVHLVLAGDPAYPPLLGAIPDPPPGLWVRGRLQPDALALAIVGSRRCTSYGQEQAGRFAGLLAACGLTVVSGGAVGIDAAAHRGALRQGGRTVAVMGCGLGVVYPRRHDRLFDAIVESGSALVSEHPMTAPPLPAHFPRRNRIISGLSLGVLVIEAARRSGALITARLATEEHGREVMVVPGRADSVASRGGLEAARDGWAGLVLSHLDVLHQLESAGHLVRGALAAMCETGSAGPLTSEQRAIIAVLEAEADSTPDAIAAGTGLSIGRTLAEITRLEIVGHVRRDGSRIVRC